MNPIAISIGPIEVRWYAILILTGFIIGMFLVKKEAIRQKLDTKKIMDLCFYLILVSIIGARLYYVIFKFSEYKENIIDVFKIWEGGLAIHGGIIAGTTFSYIYCKKNKINFLKLTDIISPALILGQAIGRWGNFFNGEAFGSATTLSHLHNLHLPNFIIKGMYLYSDTDLKFAYRHPTFFYESLWCLLGFIILLIIRRNKKIKTGQITAIYFIIYGIGRFFIESLRTDSLLFLNLKVAQIISIIMVLIGIILYVIVQKKEKNNH